MNASTNETNSDSIEQRAKVRPFKQQFDTEL